MGHQVGTFLSNGLGGKVAFVLSLTFLVNLWDEVIISDYVSEPNQIRDILKSKELSLAMVREGELMEEGPRDKM